jgi:autotransporter-associated beta strand protein
MKNNNHSPARFLSTLNSVLAVSLLAITAPAATVIWSGADTNSGNYNWSDNANWTGGTPGGNDVRFFDPGTDPGAASNINNIVDTSTTVLSLRYGNTNGFHTTLIKPGVTLAVSNNAAANLVFVGTATDSGAGQVVNATVTGPGGRLVFTSTNAASTVIVQQGSGSGAHTAILDLSGLDTFNLTAGRLLPGGAPLSNTGSLNASNNLSSNLILAKTNLIQLNGTTTPALNLGDAVSNGGANSPNNIQLGQTNAFFVDTITVGHSKAYSTLQFNPALAGSNPVLYLRGRSATRVAALALGDNSSQSGINSSCSGTIDFSQGTVDAQVSTCYVGRGLNGTGGATATGIMTLGPGVFNVGTLNVGYINNATATAKVTGTVNVNAGGSLVVVTNLALGVSPGGTAPSAPTLNITGGAVYANIITTTNGGVTSTINMTGGTLVVTNAAGTPLLPISTMTLQSGPTLQIPAGKTGANVAVGTLTLLDTTAIINVSSLPLIFGYPTQFPLINYTTLGGASDMILGTLPSTYRGYISNDLANTIWLVVTNGPLTAKAVVWSGAINNIWDTTTPNWTNAGVAATYNEGDSVNFTDAGKTGAVSLQATRSPLGFTVSNNVLNYTLTGPGSIAGPVGLLKQGSGTVTLADTGGDSFSGGIIVSAGTVILDNANSFASGGVGITNGATLQIGNNDTSGALPAGPVDDQGMLVFDRSDNVVLSAAVPGAGGLAQIGTGTLTVSSAMGYLGNTLIGGGTLALTGAGSLAGGASLIISNGTFDISGLSGQTTVNALSVTNATLSVAVSPGGQPAINVLNNLTADGNIGISNKINVISLPPIASYPTTVPIIQAANILLTAGNFNFALGNLPAGYAGNLVELGSTAVALTLMSGPVGQRPFALWTGSDQPNLNWSDRLNWQLPGMPTPPDNLFFDNGDAVAASVLSTPGGGTPALVAPEFFNNIVDSSFTAASLSYTNLNSTNHNTEILSGATLTLSNLIVGAQNANPVQKGYVTIAGPGTLQVVNSNAIVQVWNGNGTSAGASGSQAMLDMSALDTFVSTCSQLAVGASPGSTPINYPSGILYLAKTNNITTTFQTTSTDTAGTTVNAGIVVGDCVNNPGLQCFFYLGQVNTISADSIAIGRQKTSATFQFNSIYANIAPYPSVTFRGYSGAAVGLFEVGGGANNGGTTALTADVNLTGGIVNAAVNILNVGIAASAGTPTAATIGKLELDAGTFSANTAFLGFQPAGSATKSGVGTVTVGTNPTIGTNATLSVSGTMSLAVNANSSTTTGTLDVNGGVARVNTIVAGVNGAVSTMTLENGGTLVITNFAGTPAAPLTTVNLNGGTLQLNVNGAALVTNIVATSVNAAGTTINIGAIVNGLGVTTIPLISYTASDPAGGLSLGTLPPGFAGTLVDNTAARRIDLSLTTAPTGLTWVGAPNGTWNFSNLNWQNSGTPAPYADPNFVTFNDSASNSAVTLAVTVSPSEINVNNSALNYVFTGSGSISGLASVTKSGSGTLTLAGTGGDNFSGGITVSPSGGKVILDNASAAPSGNTVIGAGATVQVGNNDGNGALPSGTLTDNGTLLFQRTNRVVIPNVISGAGSLTQSGSGVVSVSGVNSYGGGTVINSGTLELVANNVVASLTGAGTGPITDNSFLAITNGGDTPSFVLVTNTITGAGVINLPQNQEVNFNGPGSLSGFTGTINIPPGTGRTAKGDITSTNVNLNAAATINVASGGTLWVGNAGVSVPAPINLVGLGNGEGWGALRVDTAANYSGPVHLVGNGSIGAQNGTSGTISGAISDGGNNYSVTKLGGAIVILTGTNTYGGGTIVSNATLQIGNGVINGTLPGNANIAVSNATLSFVVATNTAQDYSGVISGPGSFNENGFGGRLNLNGANTFTNGVTVNAGALWITNAAALGNGAKAITVNNGTAGHCELHLNGVNGNILLPATLSFFTSWIGGGGSPGAIVNEAGNNEIDGTFTLTTGGGGTAFTVNGGTLKLAGNFIPVSTSRSLQFGGAGNGAVSGVIADSGSNVLTGVTVVGPGTWTFTATNPYAVATTISGGLLLDNGVLGSGGVNVQTNGALGGSGRVSGPTTVQSGGTIQGGDVSYSNTLSLTTLNLGTTNTGTSYSRFNVAAGGKVSATTLNVSGTHTVQILDSNLQIGTNTLFTYTGTIGGSSGFSGFQLGTLPSGVTAQLLNVGSAVKLAVTSAAIKPPAPTITGPSISGTNFTMSVASQSGFQYVLEATPQIAPTSWSGVQTQAGGGTLVFSVPITPATPRQFFRVGVH